MPRRPRTDGRPLAAELALPHHRSPPGVGPPRRVLVAPGPRSPAEVRTGADPARLGVAGGGDDVVDPPVLAVLELDDLDLDVLGLLTRCSKMTGP